MRSILIIFTILTLIRCSTNNECDNRYAFSNCDLNIPIVQIEYSAHFDSVRQEIRNHFEYDLCEKCSWIDFKIPFGFEDKKGFLKVMADFDYPICENCPVPIRLRYYYTIMINRNSQLLVNGRPMKIDSLSSSIVRYYDNVGNSDRYYPENYKQVNIRFIWYRETEKNSIDKILTEVSKAYLTFVEQQVAEKGLEFCKLTGVEIENLKKEYPLRIEFDLGKIDMMKPDFEKLEQLKNVPIIEEDIEIESEI